MSAAATQEYQQPAAIPRSVSLFRQLLELLMLLGLVWTPAWCQEAAKGPGNTPPPTEEATFDVLEFLVEGNSVLGAPEIERAVYPFLGPHRHFADVEGARKALEEVYQKLGYQTVFVEIPEQRIEDGRVRLKVLEGRVEQSRVVGARYFSLGEIRNRVDELRPGSVPDFNRMQEQLAQLNRMPDRQVSPVLRAGTVVGSVDADLSVKDAFPLHADVEIDNHASPFTRPLRSNVGIHYDNLWQREHSFGLNWQTAPQAPSQANVAYGTYLWRFDRSSDVLSIYAIRSSSDIAIVGGTTVLGNARIAGLRYIKPLPGAGSFVQSLTLGIDGKDFQQSNLRASDGSIDVLPHIRYVPLGLTWGGSYSGDIALAQASLGLNTAPRGLFGNTDQKFAARRVVGEASWLAWKWDLSGEVLLGRHLSLFAHAGGQWTPDPLIPNEQASVGGADTVRGYTESELVADKSAFGSLEFRIHPFGRAQVMADSTLQRYALLFVDGGAVRMNEPLGPQVRSAQIASTGLGLRLQGWHGLRLSVDAAHALRDGGSGTAGPITRRGKTWLGFLLGYAY